MFLGSECHLYLLQFSLRKISSMQAVQHSTCLVDASLSNQPTGTRRRPYVASNTQYESRKELRCQRNAPLMRRCTREKANVVAEPKSRLESGVVR
jgi:hypothetical protein